MFHAFDADDNGYISSEEVNFDNVSAQILEIFMPLFVEMESMGETLSKEDFCRAAQNLYTTLGPIEKAAILGFKRDGVTIQEKHKNKDQTYRPKIDKNSAEIVQKSEQKNTHVVNRLLKAEQDKLQNLRQKQLEQFQEDMKECSFTPKIDEKSHRLALSAYQRNNGFMNNFSGMEMGNDLHDVAELQ